MEQFEYLTVILRAEVANEEERIKSVLPGVDVSHIGKFSPLALSPALNELGSVGWELVHMQPVLAGTQEDVAMFYGVGAAGREWTHAYFCAFKRKVDTKPQ